MKKIFIALTMLFVCIGIYFAYANIDISDNRTIEIVENFPSSQRIKLPVKGDAKEFLKYIENKTEDKNKKNFVIKTVGDIPLGGMVVVVTDENKNTTDYSVFSDVFRKISKTANGAKIDDTWYHMDSKTYENLKTLCDKMSHQVKP